VRLYSLRHHSMRHYSVRHSMVGRAVRDGMIGRLSH